MGLDVPGWGFDPPGIGIVAQEPAAAIALRQPVGDRAIVVLPDDVVLAVAVEVAGADDVPAGRDHVPSVGVVAREPAVRLAEPLGERSIVIAPEHVVPAVAIEVAGPGHMPARRNHVPGIGVVAGEAPAAVALRQPFGEGAAVVAPEDIVLAVPVEVAGADHVPVRRDAREGIGVVAGKAARRLAEPFREPPIVIAPNDVVLAVAVEVAGSRHMPAGRFNTPGVRVIAGKAAAAVPLCQPVGDRAVVVLPDDVVLAVAVEIARPHDMP